jgi:hypothetical protein
MGVGGICSQGKNGPQEGVGQGYSATMRAALAAAKAVSMSGFQEGLWSYLRVGG